jgi:hypothetical protein
MREIPSGYYRRLTLLTLLGALLVAAFAKFGVMDRIAAVSAAEARVTEAQNQLEGFQESNADYNIVKLEYDRFFVDTSVSAGYADVMDVLGIISAQLMPRAQVLTASFSGYTLSVVLDGTNLTDTSGIMAAVLAVEAVDTLNLSTATSEDGGTTLITMTIGFDQPPPPPSPSPSPEPEEGGDSDA